MTKTLSALTCLVSGWMAVMFLVLRHPGYAGRAVLAALIFAGAATVLAGPPKALRVPVVAWAVALGVVGVFALVSPGDDGWVLIAGLLFVVEAVAVAFTTSRRPA